MTLPLPRFYLRTPPAMADQPLVEAALDPLQSAALRSGRRKRILPPALETTLNLKKKDPWPLPLPSAAPLAPLPRSWQEAGPILVLSNKRVSTRPQPPLARIQLAYCPINTKRG